MKRFFISIFKFLAFLIVFILFIGLGIHSYMQFCFDKGKQLNNNIKTIFIGDSQFETGINPYFYPNSFSCSKSALQYKYILAKLKYYTEKNNIDTAFVSLAYHSLYTLKGDTVKVVPTESLDQELSYNMPFILNDKELYSSFDSISNSLKFIKYEWLYKLGIPTKPLLVELITTLQTQDFALKCVKGGFQSYTQNHISKDDFYNRFGVKVGSIKHGNLCLSEKNLAYIKRIINYCKEKNIILFFINTPLHPDLYEYNKILRDPTDSLATSLADNKEVYYLNFSNIEFPQTGFKDHNHLNSYGAEVFTKILRDSINHLSLNKNTISNLPQHP